MIEHAVQIHKSYHLVLNLNSLIGKILIIFLKAIVNEFMGKAAINIVKVEELISFLNDLLKRGIANLIDNDAGILRFTGRIIPHTATHDLGSKISLVNDARFDSFHMLMFRPNQIADKFTALQNNAWDENPLRFLIQILLEKSDPDESSDLVPAVQY